MKKFTLSLCLVALVCGLGPAHAKGVTGNETQRNYQATRSYYAQLISGATPQVAEINMLMTMLPKGGDLHHHYSGAIYAETYLEWVEKQGLCIYRESDPENRREKYRIESRKPAPGAELPKSCLKVDAIRKDNQFYREILKQWSDKDFDNHHHEQVAPDQHFFNTFGYFGPVSGYSTNDSLKMLKARAKAENMQYLETMLKGAPDTENPELAAKIDSLPPDPSEESLHQALAAFADFLASDEATKKKIADYVQMLNGDAAGIDDADFTLRFQTYVSRNSQPSRVFSSLYSAFASADGSNLIAGVNIVGPENGFVALRDYSLHMRMFRFLKQRFPAVRLSLHAGELTLGMVPPEHLRNHIREAIEIAGAERIGHGVDVTHEDNPAALLELLRARGIPVEINLTSNAFILGVEREAHPVTVYLRHRVPFVISSDDPGVSRNNISGEYVLFVSRYKPSYDMLKQVVYNSIRYSFLRPLDKSIQLRLLDERFARFEAAVARLTRPDVVKAGKMEKMRK